MLHKILLFFCMMVMLMSCAPNLFAQGKAAPKLDRQEQEARRLYDAGQYRQACDILFHTTQARRNVEDSRIARGLLIFVLLDVTGVFFFLWIEKRKAYKLLVDKNTAVAQKPLINTFEFCFEGDENSEDHDRKILQQLQQLFEVEEKYKDSTLTVNTLAQELGVSRIELSRIINQQLKCTFPTLLNQYRIREAVRLLTDAKAGQYKLEAISEMCGYNNRQVFHAAFKKETGLTPVEFRNAAQAKD